MNVEAKEIFKLTEDRMFSGTREENEQEIAAMRGEFEFFEGFVKFYLRECKRKGEMPTFKAMLKSCKSGMEGAATMIQHFLDKEIVSDEPIPLHERSGTDRIRWNISRLMPHASRLQQVTCPHYFDERMEAAKCVACDRHIYWTVGNSKWANPELVGVPIHRNSHRRFFLNPFV